MHPERFRAGRPAPQRETGVRRKRPVPGLCYQKFTGLSRVHHFWLAHCGSGLADLEGGIAAGTRNAGEAAKVLTEATKMGSRRHVENQGTAPARRTVRKTAPRRKLARAGGFGLNGIEKQMNWGTPPWKVDFASEPQPLPAEADFVVVGGGFSGLSAAAWLKEIAPERSVVLLEATRIGAGASGRTGGLALAEAAEGDLPGLGDVLGGYRETLRSLAAVGNVELPGVYEIAHSGGRVDSPIVWEDSGTLRVIKEVAGGGIDPGHTLSGLARAASRRGALLLENARVEDIAFQSPIVVRSSLGTVRAGKVLLATNAQSVELSGLAEHSWARFTLAVQTGPLADAALAALGLSSGKGFYTSDLPYLWGRPMPDGAVMFGSGLVDIADDADLATLDIGQGVAAGLFASLERRIRGLHPVLAGVEFALRWGGPIRFGNAWQMFFDHHQCSNDVIVLNGLGGDGVSFSVYLGRWAAEVFVGQRALPGWGKIPASA